MKRRLQSCSGETEAGLRLWASWVVRENQSGLGFPSVAAGFDQYQPRYPDEPPERMDEDEAQKVDVAVRALPSLERRVLEIVFVERVEKWEVVSMEMERTAVASPSDPAMNRHRARELAERGAMGVEMWLRALAA